MVRVGKKSGSVLCNTTMVDEEFIWVPTSCSTVTLRWLQQKIIRHIKIYYWQICLTLYSELSCTLVMVRVVGLDRLSWLPASITVLVHNNAVVSLRDFTARDLNAHLPRPSLSSRGETETVGLTWRKRCSLTCNDCSSKDYFIVVTVASPGYGVKGHAVEKLKACTDQDARRRWEGEEWEGSIPPQPTRRSGKRRKLLQRGLGRSPVDNDCSDF